MDERIRFPVLERGFQSQPTSANWSAAVLTSAASAARSGGAGPEP